ncbi:hypothetical protein [Gemmiger sp.]
MLNQATMDMLTSMKMTAMAAEFANQLKDPTFNELGFKERLGLLVSAEWNRRQSNNVNMIYGCSDAMGYELTNSEIALTIERKQCGLSQKGPESYKGRLSP